MSKMGSTIKGKKMCLGLEWITCQMEFGMQEFWKEKKEDAKVVSLIKMAEISH